MLKKYFELSTDEEERARNIHRKSIIIDGITTPVHSHLKGSIEELRARDPEEVFVYDGSYFQRMLDVGITASNTTIWGDNFSTYAAKDFRDAAKAIHMWYSLTNRFSSKAMIAITAENIQDAKRLGKYAVILGTQFPNVIENDLDLLNTLYRLGLRTFQLAYDKMCSIADGCYESTNCGLSEFGKEVIKELNRLGILIDLSHVGVFSSMEAIELSKDPVAITHANVYTIRDHPRNKPDELIKALAEKDGVMGITAMSQFVEVTKGIRPNVRDYVAHINHVANLVGVEHVGIGLDIGYAYQAVGRAQQTLARGPYSFETKRTEGLETHLGLFEITRGLVASGYSNQEIQKILGGNFLRVFKRVWRK